MSQLGYTQLLVPTVAYTLYHRSLTINHTLCGGSNSTNFPVLVSLSDNSLKTLANGGHVANGSGYDILFYSDSSFTIPLNWEIEYYSATTGTLVAWVLIPTVSSSINTTFYMEYGNTTISTFQGGSVGSVWNTNYEAVYHMSQASGANILDSTSNGNTGTQHGSPTSVTGQIDGAMSFVTASSQYFDTGNGAYLNGLGQMTWSAWAKRSASSKLVPILMRFTGSGQQFELYTDGNLYAGIFSDFISVANNTTSWTHYIFTFNGSNAAASRTNLYINGVLQTVTRSGGNAPATVPTISSELYIGYDNLDTPFYASGSIDEVRVLGTALAQSWITTEYNNQSAPGNIGSPAFLTISNES